MKKVYFGIMTVVLSLAVLTGCSKGYETKKTVDDLTITLKADRYPLIKDTNELFVKVADASGKTITGATIAVRYYMPAMPGMAPMEFNAVAVPKGDGYGFTANIPMEGGWKVDVTAARPGKPDVTATFNLDAR